MLLQGSGFPVYRVLGLGCRVQGLRVKGPLDMYVLPFCCLPSNVSRGLVLPFQVYVKRVSIAFKL